MVGVGGCRQAGSAGLLAVELYRGADITGAWAWSRAELQLIISLLTCSDWNTLIGPQTSRYCPLIGPQTSRYCPLIGGQWKPDLTMLAPSSMP